MIPTERNVRDNELLHHRYFIIMIINGITKKKKKKKEGFLKQNMSLVLITISLFVNNWHMKGTFFSV